MSDSPPLSVVMPVYNAERYVAAAIESILAQTFREFEFIIVDDGSQDGSLAVITRYGKRDSRIRIVSRPNTGIAVARQEGFLLSRGVYLASMDADDVSLPTRFEQQTCWMNQNPSCVLLGTGVELMDPDGVSLGNCHKELTHDRIDRRLLTGDGAAIHQSSAMMRRSAVAAVGGYRAIYSSLEDLDLFLRLAEIGDMSNLADVLLRYRMHFTSVNRTQYESQIRRVPGLVEEAMRRRGLVSEAGARILLEPPPPEVEQRRRWARQLRRSGNWRAATRHAVAAISREPVSLQSLRLLYHLARGR